MAARNNKALGKGINALFRQEPKDEPRKEVDSERNFEFYGSLMKKYVQSGSRDPAIAQMLDEIRDHLCISPEEHSHLLSTLQRREEARQDRQSKENWSKEQMNLKGELGQMFTEFKGSSECTPMKVLKDEDLDLEPIEATGAIALMDRNPNVITVESTVVISAGPSGEVLETAEGELDDLPELEDENEDADKQRYPGEGNQVGKTSPKETILDLMALMEQDMLYEALDMANRLLEVDPYSVQLLNEKGVVLYHLGKTGEALECYERGLALEPESPEININMALTLSNVGQIDRSLDLMDRAIRKDPYNEEAWNNKAVILTRIGRLRDALNCLDESLRLNGESASAWQNSGIILERLGEYGPALQCYQKVLTIEPESDLAAKGRDYCLSRIG